MIKPKFFILFAMMLALAFPAGFVEAQTVRGKARSAHKSIKHAKDKDQSMSGTPVLWQSTDVKSRDLFYGPGGRDMMPDLSKITDVEDEKGGHNKKYKLTDGSGNKWVAKLGHEAQPETVAVRLLYGLGYKTEINYLVPRMTIPGKGTFQNVRLEARPDGFKRLDEWKWRNNPFVGTDQLQGLKIMMVFMTNWDLLDMQNKVVRHKSDSGHDLDYIISDLGATFGRFGNNDIPIFYRLGRKANDPAAWNKAKFIKGVKNGYLRMAYTGGKSQGIMNGITVSQGRWLYDRLRQLKESQIRDAFRAANYSAAEIDTLTRASQRRITELGNAVTGRFAGK